VVLVAAVLDGGDRPTCEEHLDELALLADTAGYEVRGRIIQDLGRPDAATFLGKGKVAEVGRFLREAGAGQVLMDDDLAPQQAVKLEKAWKVPVSDRSGLILEIFASRARTREARTQVELASLRYLLPRLARRWSHLSRQVGGIGVRGGVGEAQIEIDRRIIRRRIARLEKDLVSIQRHRRTRREGRRRSGLYTVALVGYTNSGKSTLFNRLTRAGTRVEDRLFATLDALRRRLADCDGSPTIVTDTVGFIRKLPHHLVASFRSTLEEAGEADLLVQVVDLADGHHEEKMQTTLEVLEDLDLEKRPRLLVFNKIDALGEPAVRRRMERTHPEALFVSAASGAGLEGLRERIETERARRELEREVEIDAGDNDALALLHRHGRVVQVQEEGARLRIRYRTDRAGAGRIDRELGRRGSRAHA
jgi:GTP-binding protein HflX